MNQISLFATTREPLPVRATDVVTARDAAKRPRLKEAKATVLRAAVWCESSFTASEVHADLARGGSKMETGSVRSRLAQLARDGLVRKTTGVRLNPATDCWESCWTITAEGRAWLREDQT